MKRFVSVDSGKDGTKGVLRGAYGADDVKILFPKRVKKIDVASSNFGLLNGDTATVEFEGKQYSVGGSDGYDSFNESKAEELHRICTYTAVAKLVDNGDMVVLAVGCPLSVFINEEECMAYVEFMRGNGVITITVDGVKKTFTILSVAAFPESAGVIYLNYDKYKDKIIGVIDIGGLNTNCCVYQNARPVFETIFTTRLGGKRMRKALLDQLSSGLGMSVPLAGYQMDEVLKNGYVMNRRDPAKEELSRYIIRNYRLEHVREIYNSCVAHNWALDSMELVFIGGTSLLLKDEIKEIFGVDDSAFFKDDIKDAVFLNAEGYLYALS